MNPRIPAVLLGGTDLIRTLGLAGIPAIVASCDPDEPALASRYCDYAFILPPLSRPEAVIDALVDLSARLFRFHGRRAPLFYGNDDWLGLVQGHRDRLDGHYLMLLNDPSVALSLLDKHRFAEFAAERGLPVPRTLAWDEVRAHVGPVVAKPRLKVDWHDAPLHDLLFTDGGKAIVFESGTLAAANPLAERYRNQLLFQEFIPGDDSHLWSFNGFADEDGRVLHSFVGHKIRTWPPVTGESAYIEMVADPGLAAFGRQMAERIPLRGPFKIDLKKDPRDGRLLVLEVNARCSLWHYLGAANGVNLMEAQYDYLVEGRRTEPRVYTTHHRWLDLRLDLRAYQALSKKGQLGLFAWIRSLLYAPKLYSVFSLTDPGPFIANWLGVVVRRARRVTGRLHSMLRLWRSTAS